MSVSFLDEAKVGEGNPKSTLFYARVQVGLHAGIDGLGQFFSVTLADVRNTARRLYQSF